MSKVYYKKNIISIIEAGRFKNKIIRASKGSFPQSLHQDLVWDTLGKWVSLHHPKTLSRIGNSYSYNLWPLLVTLKMSEVQISVISTTRVTEFLKTGFLWIPDTNLIVTIWNHHILKGKAPLMYNNMIVLKIQKTLKSYSHSFVSIKLRLNMTKQDESFLMIKSKKC